MGLSYEVVVRLRLKHGKCSKGIREAKSRVDRYDLFGTSHGGKEDRKGVRIGSVSVEKKNLA